MTCSFHSRGHSPASSIRFARCQIALNVGLIMAVARGDGAFAHTGALNCVVSCRNGTVRARRLRLVKSYNQQENKQLARSVFAFCARLWGRARTTAHL
jgi:hypothetical protein